MKIGNININTPVALAPMAGVSDKPFRALCKEMGCGYTVTEMVSSRALVYQDKKSLKLLALSEGEQPCAVQIFGNDPAVMAEAAVHAKEISGADVIDINMGCPAPKIVNNGDGSALMKTPALAEQVTKAVVKAVPMVTVKIRLGWDKGSINCVEFAKMLEAAGAAAITVHGRTRSMQYSGVADHVTIGEVKRAVSVPVICNGDISDVVTARRALEQSGADGIMVGRAAFGNPWIFAQLKAAQLFDRTVCRQDETPASLPSMSELLAVVTRHFEMALAHHGERVGMLEMRKHFAWYLHGRPRMQEYKRQMQSMNAPDDFYEIVERLRRE